MDLSWMAWTWQTATFFGVILLLLVGMTVWEWASPGGAPRHGILGLDTTRGDRLFISLLGSAYIHSPAARGQSGLRRHGRSQDIP
ncbi:MAG: hypothetical protein E5Y59_03670 [Mesorhizobium sp.]|nr:MAG: hypothetical protein E5Y59_03670 [Mesorhizobium sp.]